MEYIIYTKSNQNFFFKFVNFHKVVDSTNYWKRSQILETRTMGQIFRKHIVTWQ
jgi:hypothetical protein